MGIKLASVVIMATVAKILIIPGSIDVPLVPISKNMSISATVIIRSILDIGVKCPFLFSILNILLLGI
ncbi:MAG: hypothetical protein DRO76_02495 [Candidatus Altiarchaeales archaeon]|nr:MAG: hypothetical protein DRO76_02495 [Candidatus Altiarchaeales archaeon]